MIAEINSYRANISTLIYLAGIKENISAGLLLKHIEKTYNKHGMPACMVTNLKKMPLYIQCLKLIFLN